MSAPVQAVRELRVWAVVCRNGEIHGRIHHDELWAQNFLAAVDTPLVHCKCSPHTVVELRGEVPDAKA